MTALARDRVPIDGRPVFISELKPERVERKPAFKYSATAENNKLFVKGLPPNKTKEDVEEIFKEFHPKDVRLVVKKSGQAKGRLLKCKFSRLKSVHSVERFLMAVKFN